MSNPVIGSIEKNDTGTSKVLAETNETDSKRNDEFDLRKLRLDQSFLGSTSVKKLLTTIPVHKPNQQDFIRVHPDETYRANVPLIDLQEDREMYLLTTAVANELRGEIVLATLFTAINRQGVLFLWPVRIPAQDTRVLEWHRSARDGAEMAMQKWVRLKPNMNLKAYVISLPEGMIAEPVWPKESFEDLLRIAFRDGRLINNLDHPVVKRLRGL
jgi:hypothetical protein